MTTNKKKQKHVKEEEEKEEAGVGGSDDDDVAGLEGAGLVRVQEGCSTVDSSPLWHIYQEINKRTSLQKRALEENSITTMSASAKRF